MAHGSTYLGACFVVDAASRDSRFWPVAEQHLMRDHLDRGSIFLARARGAVCGYHPGLNGTSSAATPIHQCSQVAGRAQGDKENEASGQVRCLLVECSRGLTEQKRRSGPKVMRAALNGAFRESECANLVGVSRRKVRLSSEIVQAWPSLEDRPSKVVLATGSFVVQG